MSLLSVLRTLTSTKQQHLDDHLALHAFYNSIGGQRPVLSTVGAGLPSFSGRIAGDLHFNETTAREYTLTGSNSTAVFDGFARADGALGNTTIGNKAWGRTGGGFGSSTAVLAGGKASQADANSAAFINAAVSGSRVVSCDFVMGTDNSVDLIAAIVSNGDANNFIEFKVATGSTTANFRKYVSGSVVVNQSITIAAPVAGETHTLSVDINPTAATLKAIYDGVEVASVTDPSPSTTDGWAYAGFVIIDNGLAAKAVNFTITNNDTRAWTPSVTLSSLGYSAPALPTTAATGLTKSTVGAGLPPFSGRTAGDLHRDSADGVDYKLTGAAGAVFYDSFNRAALGTTFDSGQSFNILGSQAQITSNRFSGDAAGGTAGKFAFDYGTMVGGASISADLTRSTSGDNFIMDIGVDSTGAGNHWRLNVTGTLQLTDPTGSINVLNETTGATHPVGTTHNWGLQVDVVTGGTQASVFRDGVLYAQSSVVATALSGTYGVLYVQDVNAFADNFQASANGTLQWVLGDSKESVNFVASSGAAYTIPSGKFYTEHQIVVDANTAFTFPATEHGNSFTMVLKQDGTGSHVPTWPATVDWGDAGAPTISSGPGKKTVLSFICPSTVDAKWLGFLAGKGFG